MLSIFLSEESLPPFLAEVMWSEDQLGHTEVMTLVANFLVLCRDLMWGLIQHGGEYLNAPNRKGQDGNIQVELAGLPFIRFFPETENE